jgi:formylglycine-generating enzyme required for sulfatase activity
MNKPTRIGLCAIAGLLPFNAHTENQWDDVVLEKWASGWERISLTHSWDAGGGWHWLPQAGVWVYAVAATPAEDPPEVTEDGMVLVAGGTLTRSNQTTVELAPFYMSIHEVTYGEWKAVRDAGYEIGFELYDADAHWDVGAGCADDHPVHSITWYHALIWCNAKSALAGLEPVYKTTDGEVYKWGVKTAEIDPLANGYRLPLRDEWQYAAWGGNAHSGTTYAGGNDLEAVAWVLSNSGGAACDLWEGHGTWPVGEKQPNELGLYDLCGNVAEWGWDKAYSNRMLFGGSWESHAAEPAIGSGTHTHPSFKRSSTGLRTVRNAE